MLEESQLSVNQPNGDYAGGKADGALDGLELLVFGTVDEVSAD